MSVDHRYRAGWFDESSAENKRTARRYTDEMRAYLGISKPRYARLFMFRFQFPTASLQSERIRCMGNNCCPYPALYAGMCREHYQDQFALISWSRMHTGKSWVRGNIKAFTLDDLDLMAEADRKMNENVPMLGVKGLDHPMAKLSDDEVLSIRNEVFRGDSRGSCAEKYGVSVSLISLIVRGEVRADIGGPMANFTSQERSEVSKRVAKELHAKLRAEKGLPPVPDHIPEGMVWCCQCAEIFCEDWFNSTQLKRRPGGARCRPCMQVYNLETKKRRGWKRSNPEDHPMRQYPLSSTPPPPKFVRSNVGLW